MPFISWGLLLHEQRAVVSRRQALRYLSVAAIRHRLGTRRWRPIHRGVYVTTTGALTLSQLRWAALLVAAPDPESETAFIAGRAALQAHGLRGLRNRVIEVLVPDGRKVTNPPSWVIVHRTRDLPRRDRTWIDNLPCTTTERSLVDAAQWAASEREARLVIAMSFQQGKVSARGVSGRLPRIANERRRTVITDTVADAAGGAHSLAELDFLQLSRSAGLPEPKLQYARRDATGRRRYLDAYYEKYKVHVEIDGIQHVDVQQAWADMKRQNDLYIKGDRVLRFPSWLVRERPDEVIAQVRAALIAAGWRP
jgi:very-short-patch-repair endonuclease